MCGVGARAGDQFQGSQDRDQYRLWPDGEYDTYGRAFALHYGLPGNPTVVPRNVPGGDGLKVANYIYNAAPKDGTELGLFSSSMAIR